MSIKTYHIRNGNINGKTDVTIAEMADAWGLSKNTLYSRLNRGVCLMLRNYQGNSMVEVVGNN